MSKASGPGFNLVIKDSCVSSGTLRTQDLLRAFADEYERLSPTNGADLRREARQNAEILDMQDEPKPCDWDIAGDVLNDLMDQLQYMAPEGCYFGAHEGDGACFGFWSRDEED